MFKTDAVKIENRSRKTEKKSRNVFATKGESMLSFSALFSLTRHSRRWGLRFEVMPGRPSYRFAQKVKEMKSIDSLFRKKKTWRWKAVVNCFALKYKKWNRESCLCYHEILAFFWYPPRSFFGRDHIDCRICFLWWRTQRGFSFGIVETGIFKNEGPSDFVFLAVECLRESSFGSMKRAFLREKKDPKDPYRFLVIFLPRSRIVGICLCKHF